jgi:hypothetical protein
MIGSAILLYPLLLRGRILDRWDGAVLLLGYGTYLVLALR